MQNSIILKPKKENIIRYQEKNTNIRNWEQYIIFRSKQVSKSIILLFFLYIF